MEEQEINLLELVHVLVKRKMLIFKICTVGIVASVVYSLNLPNIYSATAKILPPQKEAGGGLSALLGQAGGLAGIATGGLGGGSDLYLGILKSRSVADAVIHRLDLTRIYQADNMEAARRSLDGAIKVQAGKDGIISITAENKDPNLSAQLANAFVDELGKTTIRLNLSKAGTERIFLEKRLELVKKDLVKAENEVKYFSQRNRIVQVDSQAKASIEAIARLKADLASKEMQLAVLSSRQTEHSPDVKAIQNGIRSLKTELSVLSGKGGVGEGIPSIGNMPGVGLEYSRKLRELKTQEAIFEQLTKQYEIAKLTEAKDSSSFQILDEAVIPVNKSKPKRSIIVILSTVAAFFVSIFTVFVQEYLSRIPDSDRTIIENIKRSARNF
ncbi:GumC family protein [Citrifermentans bremense]|uniref:GumC family protein n=1 Tax=Citrifermentans bremense TaxID=60035 RepID=UPI001CF7E115|nr:Wzz/FepE/Etk N-terminal domain-containing protein [Citrifermentans bremense]